MAQFLSLQSCLVVGKRIGSDQGLDRGRRKRMWSRIIHNCNTFTVRTHWNLLHTARNYLSSHVTSGPLSRDPAVSVMSDCRTFEQQLYLKPTRDNLSPISFVFTPNSIAMATATPTCITSKICLVKEEESAEEEEMEMSSVMKKRRKKMNKHKYKKWRKKYRFLRRRLGK